MDIDATQIVAEKEETKIAYKGERGYMPIVGHLAENGLIIGEEFREGNEAPGASNLEFIEVLCGSDARRETYSKSSFRQRCISGRHYQLVRKGPTMLGWCLP